MIRGPITVTLHSVITTTDDLGDTTTMETSAAYDRVRFAPRSSSERTDPRAPAIITGATLYRRDTFPADSDDTIVIAGQDPMIDGTWQVEGQPGYWGRGAEVAIKRAAAV